jgi:hypothetical protein
MDVRKKESVFAKCVICESLKDLISKARKNNLSVKEHGIKLKKHNIHGFNLNPKCVLLTNVARKFPLFECIEACRQNCMCEAIAKEVASLDGQLCERQQELSHVGVYLLVSYQRSF